jgi:hypothetical protein
VEDNEGDILLTSEALEGYKVKTEISIAKNVRKLLISSSNEGVYE